MILLSYPRSGRNWLRYCIEHISCKPTLSIPNIEHRDELGLLKRYGKQHEKNRIQHCDKYWITHIDSEAKKYSEKPLILLLRDYKECITRHRGPNQIDPSQCDGQCQQGNYLLNVVTFHNWSSSKLIIYYEDFLTNPKDTLYSIARFLGLDITLVDNFVQQYDNHKDRSITIYNTFSESKTSGDLDKLVYHSKGMAPEKYRIWDNNLRKKNPTIYDEYLLRYKTVPELDNK